MNTKNEVFEYLIDQLRQQVDSNPYKQQCEDLAHEVQSLKNQLRDASAQIKELHLALAKATGDVEAYKLIRKGGFIPKGKGYVAGEHAPGPSVNCRCTPTPVPPEQSGCRKEDTQESCWIEWSGGACPVPCGELVDVIYRDGGTLYGLPADEINDTERDASCSFWRHAGAPNDIVRYRKAVLQ